MGAAVVAGLGSFLLTIPAFSVNSLAQVQQYAATQIPADSVVVTEQSIGDLIQQPWCTVEAATPCLGNAKYAITWRTYLQSSFNEGDTDFHEMMVGAIPVKQFSGAGGHRHRLEATVTHDEVLGYAAPCGCRNGRVGNGGRRMQ